MGVNLIKRRTNNTSSISLFFTTQRCWGEGGGKTLKSAAKKLPHLEKKRNRSCENYVLDVLHAKKKTSSEEIKVPG